MNKDVTVCTAITPCEMVVRLDTKFDSHCIEMRGLMDRNREERATQDQHCLNVYSRMEGELKEIKEIMFTNGGGVCGAVRSQEQSIEHVDEDVRRLDVDIKDMEKGQKKMFWWGMGILAYFVGRLAVDVIQHVNTP